jgi:hypothetical protein
MVVERRQKASAELDPNTQIGNKDLADIRVSQSQRPQPALGTPTTSSGASIRSDDVCELRHGSTSSLPGPLTLHSEYLDLLQTGHPGTEAK